MIVSRNCWHRIFLIIMVFGIAICGRVGHAQDLATSEDPKFVKFMTGAFPNPHSHLCVLMDANTGKVLFARNPHMRRPPASTTKMVACLVLLEHGRLADTVVAPAGLEHTEESSLHLAAGEKISLEDLLYAMMLRSANDTPLAGGYYLCRSVPKFVELMNCEVKTIGCKDTHFVTPNGLYAPGHYSSPYDLALIARYCYAHSPEFAQIVKTPSRQIGRSVHKGDNVVKSTAETFLKVFPGADGVKTGYIRQSGHCFVGSASRDGWRLIAVALNSSQCRSDVMQMLAYGFEKYKPVLVFKKGVSAGELQLNGVSGPVRVVAGSDLCDVTLREANGRLPPIYTITSKATKSRPAGDVHVGDVVGTVVLLASGKPVMVTDAIATQAAPETLTARLSATIKLGSGGRAGIILTKVVGRLALFAALSLAAVLFYARTTTKSNRRRRSRFTPNL